MQTSRLRAALLVVFGAILLRPATLPAQAVTGVGDDATTLKRGELRIGVGSNWKSWYERYGQGTPGRPNGSVEPLGVDFNLDTVGVGAVREPRPRAVEHPVARRHAGVRRVARRPRSCGLRDNTLSTPLSLEFGVTNRDFVERRWCRSSRRRRTSTS